MTSPTNSIIVGIDPGKKGAAVGLVLNAAGAVAFVETFQLMEEPRSLMQWLEHLPFDAIQHVFVEKAQAMPKNGAVSMFNYGFGAGVTIGLLIAMDLPHTLVPPALWTKQLHMGCTGDTPKKKSKMAFERLRIDIDPSDVNEGIIDAALIAEFGRRTLHCSS